MPQCPASERRPRWADFAYFTQVRLVSFRTSTTRILRETHAARFPKHWLEHYGRVCAVPTVTPKIKIHAHDQKLLDWNGDARVGAKWSKNRT